MHIVSYNPGMQIDAGRLPDESGGKYLEVEVPPTGPLVAVCWHRTKPRRLAKGRSLIEFPSSRWRCVRSFYFLADHPPTPNPQKKEPKT